VSLALIDRKSWDINFFQRPEAAERGTPMERRFRVRLDELLDDAEVHPSLLRGLLPRLESFLQPFVEALQTPQQQTNARHYRSGPVVGSGWQGRGIDRLSA